MLRFALAFALLSSPLAAQDTSATIAQQGLAATETQLAALPSPSASDRFALGGVRFLRGIERALQTRYRLGMSGKTMDVPVLRLDVAENPSPEPFYPEAIEEIFAALVQDMANAGAALDPIGGTDDLALMLNLADLWFDVNMNGARDTGEGVAEMAAGTILPRRFGRNNTGTLPTIRFDHADAAWLHAYTHLISGLSNLILAYPPAQAIEQVTTAKGEIKIIKGDAPPVNALAHLFGDEADLAMIVYLALRQDPKAEHTRAARQHFLSMIAHNRIFWARLAAENDDSAEWIPNPKQTSALGLRLPPNTGELWQAVLGDAKDLLEGRKLMPHWNYGGGAGINLQRLLDDPAPVHLAEWVHGMGLLPYAEAGERIGIFNWRNFTRLVRGDSMLYVLLLN